MSLEERDHHVSDSEECNPRKSTKSQLPNSDLSLTSHCNIKGLSVREVMRIESMITQVKFY